MNNQHQNLFRDVSLSAIAYAKEIIEPLKSKEVPTKINALFNYLRPGPNADLNKPENLTLFLKRCVTREVIDKIKSSTGVEETDEAYRRRIAQEQYNIARITDKIRLALDERGNVHFYVKLDKGKECEVSTEDTLALVHSVYEQFILYADDQEKMPIEYVLEASVLKKLKEEEKTDKEIFELRKVLQEVTLKNDSLQQEFIESQRNARITKESQLKIENELQANRAEIGKILALLEKKAQDEGDLLKANQKLKNELEQEKLKRIPESKKEQSPQNQLTIYEEMKEEIDRLVIEALQNGDLETIEAVVQEHGADCLFAIDASGLTALQWADKNKHYDAVEKISNMRKSVLNNKQQGSTKILEEQVKELAKRHDIDLNSRDLILVAKRNLPEIVLYFIENGVDVNMKDGTNETALHWVAFKGHLEICRLLIDKGAYIKAKNGKNKTPLHEAASQGYSQICKLLVEEGADINAKDESNETSLHWAAFKGHLEVCKLLLDKGADIRSRNGKNKTPLHEAASQNHPEICKFLIEKGVDVNAKDESNETPLHWAAFKGHLEICKLLLEKGADIKARSEKNKIPLHEAASQGHSEICKFLLEKGSDVNLKDQSNETSLHWAAYKGHKEVCEVLLEKGGNVQAKNEKNRTPLHEAAGQDHAEICKILMERGADINARDMSNETPLHWAAFKGYVDVCSLLLQKGANVKAINEKNKTPLHEAATQGHTQICRLLLERGADVNAKDHSNETPLHWAAYKGHTEACELLLKNGADGKARNEKNKTAIDEAESKGNLETLELLKRYSIKEKKTQLHKGMILF